MTNVRQLYILQGMDLVLDRLRQEADTAKQELNAGLALDELETGLQEESERLQELQSQQRLQQLEAEGQRERSARLDEQLYGGALANPRDLESLELEASRAREVVQRQATELLELSVQAEEAQTNHAALAQQLADAQSAWQNRQSELKKQTERLTAEQKEVGAKRDRLAATLDATEIGQYENLRQAKAGLAVAKMERGLCQACRMSLPTQQQQQVKSGRYTVLCNSCGRMLFPG
jgi:predicted  nucleic acid-binding Zn-ribbon protein